MCDTKAILQLYTNVMYADVVKHSLTDLDIATKISNMTCSKGFAKAVDYNNVLYRCAYLHMYAPLHTAIVKDTMRRLLSDRTNFRFSLESGILSICSLGGGPGSDVVGVLAALDGKLGSSRPWYTFVSVVDDMEGWHSTFRSVVKELRRSEFSPFSSRFAEEAFNGRYLRANLLHAGKCKVWDTVAYSSLVTMVKCLSMFQLKDARKLIKKVFTAMTCGSSILIIDDTNKKRTEITLNMAREHQLIPIFGPFKYGNYSFSKLKVTRFGHTSCHQANVTSILLTKPFISPRSLFSSESRAPTNRLCVACRDQIHLCARCRSARDFRNSLYSVLEGLSHLSSENEFRTPDNSSPSSPNKSKPSDNHIGSACIDNAVVDNSHSLFATDNAVLSDSVVTEVPE